MISSIYLCYDVSSLVPVSKVVSSKFTKLDNQEEHEKQTKTNTYYKHENQKRGGRKEMKTYHTHKILTLHKV